jgi:hypothetical protein
MPGRRAQSGLPAAPKNPRVAQGIRWIWSPVKALSQAGQHGVVDMRISSRDQGQHRCHGQDDPSLSRKDSRTSGWLIPVLISCAVVSLPGGGITSCRPPGIPSVGFVLAQEFEEIMT